MCSEVNMKLYVLRDDNIHGPFSKAQVIAARKQRKLKESDLIGKTVSGPWQSLEKAFGSNQGADKSSESSDLVEVEVVADSPGFGGVDLGAIELPPAANFVSTPPRQPTPHRLPAQASGDAVGQHLDAASREINDEETKAKNEDGARAKRVRLYALIAVLVLVTVPTLWLVTADSRRSWRADAALDDMIYHATVMEDSFLEGRASMAVKHQNLALEASERLKGEIDQMSPTQKQRFIDKWQLIYFAKTGQDIETLFER
jgi:hypothetical protein